nr:response regulator [Myxococcota bacterium]
EPAPHPMAEPAPPAPAGPAAAPLASPEPAPVAAPELDVQSFASEAAAIPAPLGEPAAGAAGLPGSESVAPAAADPHVSTGVPGASPLHDVQRLDRERLVLVAHANPDACKVLVESIEGWGLQVVVAHDGVEAMLGIQRTLPRLVLLDAALPKMFGFQVCEIVKRNESLRSIQVALIGAIHNEQRYRRLPNELYGADAYVEAQDLPEALRGVCERVGLLSRESAPAAAPVAVEAPAETPAAPVPVEAPAVAPVAPAAVDPPAVAPVAPAAVDAPAAPLALDTPAVEPAAPLSLETPAVEPAAPVAVEVAAAAPASAPAAAPPAVAPGVGAPPAPAMPAAAAPPAQVPAPEPLELDQPLEPAPAVQPVAAPPVDELAPARAEAERLARIIVSDIVLYNPEKFATAIRGGNVLDAMQDELHEGRALLSGRIDPRVRDAHDFVAAELLRVARSRGSA